MPQSIPQGLTRDHVLKALADLDAAIEQQQRRFRDQDTAWTVRDLAPLDHLDGLGQHHIHPANLPWSLPSH